MTFCFTCFILPKSIIDKNQSKYLKKDKNEEKIKFKLDILLYIYKFSRRIKIVTKFDGVWIYSSFGKFRFLAKIHLYF